VFSRSVPAAHGAHRGTSTISPVALGVLRHVGALAADAMTVKCVMIGLADHIDPSGSRSMAVRLSAVIRTPDGLLLAVRESLPDNTQRHLLPGRVMDEPDEPFGNVLLRILRQQLNINASIGALVHLARTGAQDEYSFVAHADEHETFPQRGSPAPGGGSWDGIDLTPAAIHIANFMPKELGLHFAGNLRHGRPPWALPDIRSRPPVKRRHGKAR
jgi:hypothetical protein